MPDIIDNMSMNAQVLHTSHTLCGYLHDTYIQPTVKWPHCQARLILLQHITRSAVVAFPVTVRMTQERVVTVYKASLFTKWTVCLHVMGFVIVLQ